MLLMVYTRTRLVGWIRYLYKWRGWAGWACALHMGRWIASTPRFQLRPLFLPHHCLMKGSETLRSASIGCYARRIAVRPAASSSTTTTTTTGSPAAVATTAALSSAGAGPMTGSWTTKVRRARRTVRAAGGCTAEGPWRGRQPPAQPWCRRCRRTWTRRRRTGSSGRPACNPGIHSKEGNLSPYLTDPNWWVSQHSKQECFYGKNLSFFLIELGRLERCCCFCKTGFCMHIFRVLVSILLPAKRLLYPRKKGNLSLEFNGWKSVYSNCVFENSPEVIRAFLEAKEGTETLSACRPLLWFNENLIRN
uniref:Translation initiation factor IF-2 n=1 Tax=Anthurium amnicola TaxID=1678845 RepID=A0A1D1YER7_9ARAE